MNTYTVLQQRLIAKPQKWLITGVAGFIGSNLLEYLLKLNQTVVGLDNLATGHMSNILDVKEMVSPAQWSQFRFIDGDIRKKNDCIGACKAIDYVLHQAALGSVPRSILDPETTHQTNVDGFMNMLIAARDCKVRKFVYAASSSTYGDSVDLPKIESRIGNPLSPYAVTKYVNELYANVFSRVYGMKTTGLRYFNVFGKRQDPNGVYAAVIPRWIIAMMSHQDIHINGDGETSRDFCYIENVIQANILAAAIDEGDMPIDNIYNVAYSQKTTLNQLAEMIANELKKNSLIIQTKIKYDPFREGDIRHSLANIEKIENELGYRASHNIEEGLSETLKWYVSNGRNKFQ